MVSMNFKKPHWSYARWAADHGAIYHLRFGVMHQVVLSDPQLIREAFGKPELAGRPDTALFRDIIHGKGLSSSTGEIWQQSRRMTLHHLRNLGMGKNSLEDYIHRQIGSFMDEVLTPGCGQELELGKSLDVAVVNIIWKLVASEELSLGDTKIIDFMAKMSKIVEVMSSLALLDAAPWLGKLIPSFVFNVSGVEREVRRLFESVIGEAMRKRREQHDVSDEPKDYMDAIFLEQRERPELFTDYHIMICIGDLFFGGSDSISTTLRWALSFLCSRPECQKKLQAELDEHVGRNRPPSLADRQQLPYTEAVIMETQRLADISPGFFPHVTLKPVTIGGYDVPEGVMVIGNAHHVHFDKDLFPDPHEFRPERFLDAEGNFTPDRNVMPFSAGKRQCLGESLARPELFLFLTTFLQNFTFSFPEGFKHDLSESKQASFTRDPAPFKLIPKKR